MDREQNQNQRITVPSSLNLKDYIQEMPDRSFIHFRDAYDNVDVEHLSDEELDSYGALCENGYTEYLEEKRKRGK